MNVLRADGRSWSLIARRSDSNRRLLSKALWNRDPGHHRERDFRDAEEMLHRSWWVLNITNTTRPSYKLTNRTQIHFRLPFILFSEGRQEPSAVLRQASPRRHEGSGDRRGHPHPHHRVSL